MKIILAASSLFLHTLLNSNDITVGFCSLSDYSEIDKLNVDFTLPGSLIGFDIFVLNRRISASCQKMEIFSRSFSLIFQNKQIGFPIDFR